MRARTGCVAISSFVATRVAVGTRIAPRPRTDPYVRHYRIRCGRPHLMRNVASAHHMWRPAATPWEDRSPSTT